MKLIIIILSLLIACPASADSFTDAEVLGISLTTEYIQIQAQNLVCPRISYWDLKNLCNTLVNDNLNYQTAVMNFVRQSGIEPVTSKRAQAIDDEGQKAIGELKKLDGYPLDHAYLNYQLKLYADSLRSIQEEFLPSISHPRLRNMIQGQLPVIVQRYQWAEKIKQTIGLMMPWPSTVLFK